ncbi:unnamed protein product [Caenorhabditis angaria]|uniref:Protein kinase domain-containing protein n=1 Tax=Caenorhabditis angaria TaxID=860376 RepID=A0A9P1ILQ0_9PELO|nr:unnamed protein product [Caenorhabditis angaria]
MNILVFPGNPTNGRRSNHLFKLCDLGAGKAFDDKNETTPNEMYSIVGTKNMLLPNMANDLRRKKTWRTTIGYTGDECDLWCLGLTLYHCSTGRFSITSDNSDDEVYCSGTTKVKQDMDAIATKFKGKYYDQMSGGIKYDHEIITELPTSSSNRLPKWLTYTITCLIRLFIHNPSIDKYATISNYLKTAPRKKLLSIDKLSIIEQCDMSKCPFIGFNFPTISECLGYSNNVTLSMISLTSIRYTEPKQKDFKNLEKDNDVYLVIPQCEETQLRSIGHQKLEYVENSTIPEAKLFETRRQKIMDGLSFLRDAEEIAELFEKISQILTTQFSLIMEELQNDERIQIASRYAVYLETALIPVAIFSQNSPEKQEHFQKCVQKAGESRKELDNHSKTSQDFIKSAKDWRDISRKLKLQEFDTPGIKEEFSEFFVFDKNHILETQEYSQTLVGLCLEKRSHLLRQLYEEQELDEILKVKLNKIELSMQTAQYLLKLRNDHLRLQQFIEECTDFLEIPHQEMKKITNKEISNMGIDRTAIRRSIRYQSPKYQEAQKKIKPAAVRIQELSKILESACKEELEKKSEDTIIQQPTIEPASEPENQEGPSENTIDDPTTPVPMENPSFFTALIHKLSRSTSEI